MTFRLTSVFVLALPVFILSCLSNIHAAAQEVCPRPQAGSVVRAPQELRSRNGVLELALSYASETTANGQTRYCYRDKNGDVSPTLVVHPGDLLVLHLKNDLKKTGEQPSMSVADPCASGSMSPLSTNLHFHGLTVPPVCHKDDVLHTAVGPGDAPFTYSFHIPANEPPGVYWYHPHIHGFTNTQVMGGASGALIVEGMERADSELAGLPVQLFVIRDQELLHPDAPPAKTGITPPEIHDPEGDVLNNGTGTGKPSRDISINFVPVPYPDYPPATILIKPRERQLWRVLNASAATYVDLVITAANRPQDMGVVALDGVPINENGMEQNRVLWTNHIFVPPASRVDFIFKGLPQGAQAMLITRGIDTGPLGENHPVRPIATIVVDEKAPKPEHLPAQAAPLPNASSVWLGDVKPARTRRLYFSEYPQDPNNPKGPTVFMITEEGKTPAPYDPHATQPDIVVRDGEVEDWVIENRSPEVHTFHIHQVHFMLTQWNGAPVDEPFLRDTINVPYWKGNGTPYPSVTLRMDFRDPNAVGTFLYHCHLLDHEDGGMMGTIQVLPAKTQ